MTALVLAVLLLLGGAAGLLNLLVDGVLRDGAPRQVYAATMLLPLVAAGVLLVRRRVGSRGVFALVLLGHLTYVVVALCVEDPLRYATPLMLLFSCFVAACFLGPWQLATTMVLTVVACAVALQPGYADPAVLAIQVGVSAGMLDATALGVFLLRRRVQRLLVTTQMLSNLDPLTGLYNRRYLVEQAPRLWRQARRDGTQVVAMVLDLDHFKRLNDQHGHAAGDAVLRSVARSLAAAVRPSDVLVRTGGEELVVLGLAGDAAEAAKLAERLRAAVASTTTDGHAVTASIGVALNRPVEGEDVPEAMWRLVDQADLAMYEAKRAGRDRVAATAVPRARRPAAEGRPAVPGVSPTDVG